MSEKGRIRVDYMPGSAVLEARGPIPQSTAEYGHLTGMVCQIRSQFGKTK